MKDNLLVTCFGENTEKYINLSVSIGKKLKKRRRRRRKISHKNYIIQMTIHWPCKIDGKLIIKSCYNPPEGIHKIKCKYGYDDKNL